MMTLQNALATVSSEQQEVSYLRLMVEREHPKIIQALRLIDQECTSVKHPKGYNLLKVKNKRLGFVFYVRYWHEGKMLTSKWCTGTNIYQNACEYAIANRERLISLYTEKNGGEVIRFFENFFEATNPIFQSECKRNRNISEDYRRRYFSAIRKKFVPFLLKKGVKTFDAIDVPLLDDFQDELLATGIKSFSVNAILKPVGNVLAYLVRKGTIKFNPYLSLASVPLKSWEQRTHGCYELAKLKGVFDKEWIDHKSFLLNLIAYTTNMRNIEIIGFGKNDMTLIDGCRFVDIKRSKTKSGVRLVPLHDTVYRHIVDYAGEAEPSSAIFGETTKKHFMKASCDLGVMMNASKEYLAEHNITFYSGRHAWKTMMNDGELGEDIEEVFMGHKVSSNVAKLYNHKDKQGQERTVKKAREVFKILDAILFEQKNPSEG
jgi:integrase